MGRIIAKLHELLDKANITNWLGIVLFLTILLRIPSFFEPYYYGDEMIYLNLGEGVRQGQILYKEIFDNKPPLIYLTAALAGNLFWFKAILAFWNLATIVIFWNLVRLLFDTKGGYSKNEKLQKVSTVFFALLTTLPTLEGNTVNAELFMVGPSLLAFFFLIGKSITPKKIFYSGILFGIASLFKVPAAFDVPVIIIYWVIVNGFKNWKSILKDTFVLSLGFVTPILLSFIGYFFQGALSEYFKAAFMQNLGYIESWQVKVPMTIRGGVVALGSLIVFIFRKKLSSKFILLCLWTLFSLFAVILSQRPYPHYLIQSVAPLSLLIGMLLTQKNVEQSLSIIPLTLIIFVPFFYRFYDYKVAPYYLRFINFASGKMTREAYFNDFSPNTDRNYKIAEFLATSSKPSEKIFIWDSDAPIIYSLARRIPPTKYVVPYHVNDYSNQDEIAKTLSESKPKFIVLTPSLQFPEIQKLIKTNYILINEIENAQIWSRISQ